MSHPYPRKRLDAEAYGRQSREGPCFICAMLAGHPDYLHHLVFENEHAVAFLDCFPTLYGYTLVVPRRHLQQVTGDFSLAEYLDLQCVLYGVAEAVRQEVQAERVYLLSLGSQQGNSHVHWHVAPLPPGVPYERQQLPALVKSLGVLDIPDNEMALLAARLRARLGLGGSPSAAP